MKPVIVAAAYDRAHSLKRLLRSLAEAEYHEDDITLIISIDHSGFKDCAEAAEGFEWEHGEKIIRQFKERQGLKKHILSCGDYAETYGSAIILEDDLTVAESFYDYACAALSFTGGDDRVGGVSLYAHQFNVFAREPFQPVEDGYDNWYMKFASSWGQAVTDKQWGQFRKWLAENDGKDLHSADIPDQVAEWSDNSWLKYHIRYLSETGRYFLYPRVSHTTNFADEGEHAKKQVTDLQVPLAGKKRREPVFSSPDLSSAVYDAFFENESLDHPCDLYGLKSKQGKLGDFRKVYSAEALPYRAERTFGMSYRPMDVNLIKGTEGNKLFLYDLETSAAAPAVNRGYRVKYFYRGLNKRKIWDYVRNSRNI